MEKNLKTFKKTKQYDEIYKLYGSKNYLKCTPIKVQKKEQQRLLEEGRFNEYYEKFGERNYNEHINYIQTKDMERELGIHIHYFNKPLVARIEDFKVVRKQLLKSGVAVVSALLLGLVGLQMHSTQLAKENEIKYESELEEYNQEIEQYAQYIQSLNLSDFEIAMKVMSDMWANIEGYKTPSTYDETGVLRLSLYENGYGVCRNMADDYTARMNAINPSFEAQNLIVYIEQAQTNNIKRTILENNQSEENTQTIETGKYIGNHLVTCIHLQEEGITLVVDVTNPSIGIFKNGKIYMLSNTKTGMKLPIFNQSIYDFSYQMTSIKELLKSFLGSGTYEEYMDKYGIDSQNEILKDLESFEDNHYHTK
jgi:hypothetical protein